MTTYSATSDTGNFAEALEQAIQTAKETIPSDFVRWKLVELSGSNGGFILENKLTVTIEAAPH